MKAEKEKLQLKPFHLVRNQNGGVLSPTDGSGHFQLSILQATYLDVLARDLSIEDTIQFFLGQGWLVSFRELYALLQLLASKKIISNPLVLNYLTTAQTAEDITITKSFSGSSGLKIQLDPTQLPFFRSLDPQLGSYLLQGAERFQVAAQTRITQSGKNDRDLFILLSGQASVYKVINEKQRQLVATLQKGALFGERGFLLNQPRNADIITTTTCEILRVKHLAEFDSLIKSEKAQSLQHRFWVLHALLSSPFFKELPGDTLDALIFAGRLLKASAHQVLFQEGQPGNTCYILIQGSALVSQKGQTINVLNQGSCFGEISLLVSGGQRTATVTTQRDSILMEIQQNDFYRILSQNIILAVEMENLAAFRVQKDQSRKN